MVEMFCAPWIPGPHGKSGPPDKYYGDGTGQYFGYWPSRRALYSFWRKVNITTAAFNDPNFEKFDCKQCKHRLACLVKTDCLRTFESK